MGIGTIIEVGSAGIKALGRIVRTPEKGNRRETTKRRINEIRDAGHLSLTQHSQCCYSCY